jgi:uncharacterized membrane protein YphA (DoxX/SURF4 family)
MIKKYFASYSLQDWVMVVIRIFLGAMFLFSGAVKLVPIEPFEMKFVEIGVASWKAAPFFARTLIGIEFALGVLLIFNLLPKWTLGATWWLLIGFVAYLVYDLYVHGNEGNCGCFGTFIKMTPLESLLKNVLLLPLVFLLLLKNKKEWKFYPYVFAGLFFVLSMGAPYVLYPVDDLDGYVRRNAEETGYPFPTALIPDFSIEGQKVDLTQGKYLLAFISLSCEHCKTAAYKLHILNAQKKLPPVYLVIVDSDEYWADFENETKANFPKYYFPNERNFFEITGYSVPKIFYIEEGIVKGKFDNVTLTDEMLDKAMGITP